MKTPFDTVKGEIISYNEQTGEVLIRATYDDWFTALKRQYRECLVQMIDSRPLSSKQRNACYALIGEISDYVGEGRERTKQYMKIKFLAEDFGETADKIFSLANAPMSLVCAFQKYLVDFILQWDIPCHFTLLQFVDDIPDYVYSCLVNRKCCVCGKRADLHHVDRIGMGRNREEIIHEGMEVMPLCREHHNECHILGQQSFEEKYHFEGGVILDRTLCKIYGLTKRGRKESQTNERDQEGAGKGKRC